MASTASQASGKKINLAQCIAAAMHAKGTTEYEVWRRALLPRLQRASTPYLSPHQYWILYAMQAHPEGIEKWQLAELLTQRYFEPIGFSTNVDQYSYSATEAYLSLQARMRVRGLYIDVSDVNGDHVFQASADGIAAREIAEDWYQQLKYVARANRRGEFETLKVRKGSPHFGRLMQARPSQTAILAYASSYNIVGYDTLWNALKTNARTPASKEAFYDHLMEMRQANLVSLGMQRGQLAADQRRRRILWIKVTEAGDELLAQTLWLYLDAGSLLPTPKRVRPRPMGRPNAPVTATFSDPGSADEPGEE